MSESENNVDRRYSDERAQSPRSRSRSLSPLAAPRSSSSNGGHHHHHHHHHENTSSSRYRSRSRSRDMPRDDQNPGDNLFVTGLSARTNSADLEELFSKYGKIQKAEVMYDPHTRESRGFGFIRMVSSEDADRAIQNINNTEVDGRVVSVEKARRARPRTPTPGRYYGPPKRGPRRSEYRAFDARYEARAPRGGDPRYDRYYDRAYMDRYDSPRYDRGYERGGYDRGGYDRGAGSGAGAGGAGGSGGGAAAAAAAAAYDRASYDRYDRYERYDRRAPPPRYDPYPPRPRSPY